MLRLIVLVFINFFSDNDCLYFLCFLKFEFVFAVLILMSRPLYLCGDESHKHYVKLKAKKCRKQRHAWKAKCFKASNPDLTGLSTISKIYYKQNVKNDAPDS